MSGVHATQARTDGGTTPDLEAHLDTLYEILATGVEPPEGVSLERIEAFLHEHARAAKGVQDFVSFFRQAGLAVRTGEDARAPLRVLDPLPPVEAPPSLLLEPALDQVEVEDATRPSAARPSAGGATIPAPAFALAAVALLALGATMTWGYATLTNLRAELAHAQAQAADNRIAIQQLDEQVTQVQQTVGETDVVMRRFERKNDMLLEALLPAPINRP